MVPFVLSASLLTALAAQLFLPATAEFSASRIQLATNPQVVALEGAHGLPAAEVSLKLSQKVARSSRKKQLRHSLREYYSTANGNPVAILAGSSDDDEYLVNVTAGGQHFSLIVDTGSSDTWFAKKGFKCFNLTSYPEPEKTCAFGSAGFDTSKSKTFKPYPDHNFNISYGDGEFLTGTVGFEKITVGGLTVDNQEFGLVNKAAWVGDGVNTGLLGLAFPAITSVFKGTNPNNDSSSNYEPYDPFFFTAIKEKKVKNPYFSIALNRGSFSAQESGKSYDPNLGFLAFGGIAPVATTSPSVRVPLDAYKTKSRGSSYYYYIAQVDNYIFPGSSSLPAQSLKSNSTILDSGTTVNYLPDDVAAAYAKAFSPIAKISKEYGGYVVTCEAKVPKFQVVIGGQKFTIDGRDQLLPLGVKDSKGKEICFLGTQPGGSFGDIFILGDTFLHNVVSTFDVVSKHVTLTQRKKY